MSTLGKELKDRCVFVKEGESVIQALTRLGIKMVKGDNIMSKIKDINFCNTPPPECPSPSKAAVYNDDETECLEIGWGFGGNCRAIEPFKTTCNKVPSELPPHITDLSYIFEIDAENGLYNESEEIIGIDKWDTKNITNLGGIPFEYKIPFSLPNIKKLDLSNWNTKNVTDMNGMFFGCAALTTLDLSNFDTKNVTNISGMFFGCAALTTLDLSNFDTKNVTNISGMFWQCDALTTLDLSNFDTSSVTDMNSMFFGCAALTTLDLSNFDTSSVTDMNRMFSGCAALTTLDLSNFDTSSVTDMNSMFSGCAALTTLDLSNFDTSSVTDMNSMFFGCAALTTLDLSNFDTSSVTDMNSMFEKCIKLIIIKGIENWDTSNLEKVSSSGFLNNHGMFMSCKVISPELDLSKWNVDKVTDHKNFDKDANPLWLADKKPQWKTK